MDCLQSNHAKILVIFGGWDMVKKITEISSLISKPAEKKDGI